MLKQPKGYMTNDTSQHHIVYIAPDDERIQHYGYETCKRFRRRKEDKQLYSPAFIGEFIYFMKIVTNIHRKHLSTQSGEKNATQKIKVL